jgi:Protein of unknown function (DUF2958)
MTDHMNRPDRAADNAHDLMPGWLAATVPALYSQESVETPLVRVKFFTPDAQWTWFVLEYDPAERPCFGLVCGQVDELGYFSLDELRAVRGPLGLRIERDLWWEPVLLRQVRSGEVR